MSNSSWKSKSEDANVNEIREIQRSSPENKKCLDCGLRGPTYVNMTIGSFVCTKCCGILRGITPPHRIKSISMSTFNGDEISFLRSKGNHYCQQVWCATIPSDSKVPSLEDDSLKNHLIDKYERKRYYVDPSSIYFEKDTRALNSPETTSQKSSSSENTESKNETQFGSSKYSRPLSSSSSSSSSAAANGLPSLVTYSEPKKSSVIPTKTTTATNSSEELKKKNSEFESFANFDTAFSSPGSGLLDLIPSSTQVIPQVSESSKTPVSSELGSGGSSEDRYAALKDLDEIFKTTVSFGENSQVGTSEGFSSTLPSFFESSTLGTFGTLAQTSLPYKNDVKGEENVGWANFGNEESCNPFMTGGNQHNTSPWPNSSSGDPFSVNYFTSDNDLFAKIPQSNFNDSAFSKGINTNSFGFSGNISQAPKNPWDSGIMNRPFSTNPFL